MNKKENIAMDTNKNREKQLKVSFSNVEVRHYPYIPGNHPETLSWEFTYSWPIDEFESVIKSKKEIIDESGWEIPQVKNMNISTEGITKVMMDVCESQKSRKKTITEIRISSSYDKIAKYDFMSFSNPIAEIIENIRNFNAIP